MLEKTEQIPEGVPASTETVYEPGKMETETQKWYEN